jgi:hypothetical protein
MRSTAPSADPASMRRYGHQQRHPPKSSSTSVSSGQTKQNSHQCRFFELPRELRDMIYIRAGHGNQVVHVQNFRKDHKIAVRYSICQANITFEELYNLTTQGAHPNNPWEWRSPCLSSLEPTGPCRSDCYRAQQAAIPLPVSQQFYHECLSLRGSNNFFFSTAPALSAFVTGRSLTHPHHVRNMTLAISQGLCPDPMQWGQLFSPSTFAHFEQLENVNIHLIVCPKEYQPSLKRVWKRLYQPKGVNTLQFALGNDYYRMQDLLYALQPSEERPVNCRLVIQQHGPRMLPVGVSQYADLLMRKILQRAMAAHSSSPVQGLRRSKRHRRI